MPVITLTTDFGFSDWFVGVMKGVILQRCPRATVVDLDHGVAPGNIRAGAFALQAACGYFPPRTIHVAVVDPGVGGKREAIALRTRKFVFVGPDNGVLSWAVKDEPVCVCRRITNDRLFLKPLSRTFHGRDLFAPVAAHLAAGRPFHQLGPPADRWVRLEWPEARRLGEMLRGEVLYVDRFGNAITNLPHIALAGADARRVAIHVRRRTIRFGASYDSVAKGEPVGVAGSTGYLELAVNGGSAARTLRLRAGQEITVQLA